jgi:apolipoprotein N-acyltransferase
MQYLTAAVLMAVPPFGITGWAHPITAAGILFPGWSWVGLAAAAAGLTGMTSRLWPVVAITLGGFWIWSAAAWTDPKLRDSWRGIDLHLGATLGRDNSLQRQQQLIDVAKKAGVGAHAETVVFPESALGFWTPTAAHLWQSSLTGTNMTVIGGAVVIDAGGYDNALVEVSATGSRVLYRERMPVLGAMWQPWRPWLGQTGGAKAHFFDNPVVDVGATKVAPLICYEQLIVWPVLQSMIHDPDIIVAVGNGWWTSGTAIVDIQRASAEAWARLFDKPLILSFNI